jgi:hypothetical protein
VLICYAPILRRRQRYSRGPRALKSELSIRPLFHQGEPRVKAHVMVAFLSYALWVTLKHLLKRRPTIVPKPSMSSADNAQPLSPMRALALLSTLQSADIVLPTTDGHEIRLRRITEPTAEQKSILQQLGISLPDRFESIRTKPPFVTIPLLGSFIAPGDRSCKACGLRAYIYPASGARNETDWEYFHRCCSRLRPLSKCSHNPPHSMM